MGGTKTLLSIEEFAKLPDDENRVRHELDEGALITVPVPLFEHTNLQTRLSRRLHRYLDAHAVGEAYVECGHIIGQDPPTVLRPDLSFVRADRVGHVDSTGWLRGGPDLAIDVVCPSNSTPSLLRRVSQFLEAGSHTVWLVYPGVREVHVFEASGALRVVGTVSRSTRPNCCPASRSPLTNSSPERIQRRNVESRATNRGSMKVCSAGSLFFDSIERMSSSAAVSPIRRLL